MDHAKVAKADATYARQSAIRVRSGIRLVLLLLGLALLTFVTWGNTAVVKGLLFVAVFFALVTGFEAFNVHLLMRRRERSIQVTDRRLEPSPEFELVTTDDKENAFERRVLLSGRTVRLVIMESLFRTIAPHAKIMADDMDRIGSLLRTFLEREALRMPEFADVIRGLEPDTFLFLPDARRPPGFIVQVSFTAESGGEPWLCYWDGTQFLDLQLES